MRLLVLFVLKLSVLSLQAQGASFTFELGQKQLQVEKAAGAFTYWIDGEPFQHSSQIRLRQANWLTATATDWRVDRHNQYRLLIVQFNSKILPAHRAELKKMGVAVVSFVPDHGLLVRTPLGKKPELAQKPYVHQLLSYGPHHKGAGLPDDLFVEPHQFISRPYDILVWGETARSSLLQFLKAENFKVLLDGQDSFAIRVEASPDQLKGLLPRHEVTWVEEAPAAIEYDMDIVHIQGGTRRLFAATGSYRGEGVRGHVLEGIYPKHQDFVADHYRGAPVAIGNDTPSSHGQRTFGMIFGSGRGDQKAMGLLPRAQGFYTSSEEVFLKDNRYKLTQKLINYHHIQMQTASWGYPMTKEYDARSLEMDKIIFKLDLPITQSQSNSGDNNSRPQAWAKNIISVGAVVHHNDTNFANDSWELGSASIGPAADGRVKPDLVGYYDGIYTTSIDSYGLFGGTSAATPMVNGFLGVIIEMWREGLFYDPHRIGRAWPFRPAASTAKALLINGARPYPFRGASDDMTRMHQGWGHPSVERLFRLHQQTVAINESLLLWPMQKKRWKVTVTKPDEELRATLVYTDPPGLVGAEIHRVNDLDLKLVSPSGVVYHGNYGLMDQEFSIPGGTPDPINTVENVFIPQPEVGEWTVEVHANELNMDGHLGTIEIETGFALVVSGIEI